MLGSHKLGCFCGERLYSAWHSWEVGGDWKGSTLEKYFFTVPFSARRLALRPEQCRHAFEHLYLRQQAGIHTNGFVCNLPLALQRQHHRASLVWKRNSFPSIEGGVGVHWMKLQDTLTLHSHKRRKRGAGCFRANCTCKGPQVGTYKRQSR